MSIYNQLSSPKPPALTDNENIKAKAGAPVIPVPAESNLTEYFSDDEDWWGVRPSLAAHMTMI